MHQTPARAAHHDHKPYTEESGLSYRECRILVEDRYYDGLGPLQDVLKALHLSRSRYNLMLSEAGMEPPDE